MRVIIPKEFDYLGRIRELLRHGGPHGRAAQKAIQVQDWLQRDIDLTAQTTDHGESRIRGCIKYDLGNGFRLVTVRRGDTSVLLNIGSHDEMQRWLDANDGLEVVMRSDDQRVAFPRPHRTEPWQVEPTTQVTPSNIPFLQRMETVQWDELISSRSARHFLLKYDEDGDDITLLEVLEELREKEPRVAELCLTVITHLKKGEPDAAQAAADVFLGRAKPVLEDESLTNEVFDAEANQGRFIVLNDLTDAELGRLHDPLRFQDWMLFLHPGQRRVVEEEFVGPALLTGVSGSGKTSVLVHRARELANRYPREAVLVVTLNRSLARLIQNLVKRLCLDGEESRIDVVSFYDYLAEVLSGSDLRQFLEWFGDYLGLKDEVKTFLDRTPEGDWPTFFRAPSEVDQIHAFEDFLSEPDNPARSEYDRLEVYVFSQDQSLDLRRYLFEELELVRSAFLCYDAYAGYHGYLREGRAILFAEKRRDAVLNILREWERWQVRNGRLDQMGLTQVALFAFEGGDKIPARDRRRAVLVDEFQDFSTLELRILKNVPTDAQDGLFLTGDLAQKVFAKDLNLPAAELGRAERTDRVIRQNYRNSRQILVAANSLLEQFPPPAGAGEDGVIVLKPKYARRETAKPIATKADDIIAAAWDSAGQWLDGGHVAFSVCIATANPSVLPVEALLTAKPTGIEGSILTGDYILMPSRVVVSDITSVKGFEFSLMIIVGLDAEFYPSPGVPREEHWREALRLYVAITRGRDEVRFFYRGQPSSFLLAMESHIQFHEWLPRLVEPATTVSADSPTVLCTEKERNLPTLALAEDQPDSAAAERAVPVVEVHTFATAPPNRPETEFLNGIPIVGVGTKSTQDDIASILGTTQTAISLLSQELGIFVPPNTPLSRHIVAKIFDRYGCVPNFLEGGQ